MFEAVVAALLGLLWDLQRRLLRGRLCLFFAVVPKARSA